MTATSPAAERGVPVAENGGATPGPWNAAAQPSSVVGWPIVAQTGRLICNVTYVQHSKIDLPVPGDRTFNAEAKANARLIAAAPDLLTACIASEKERDNNEDYSTSHLCGECNMGTGPHRQTCAHHLRVAAIAKATGEQ